MTLVSLKYLITVIKQFHFKVLQHIKRIKIQYFSILLNLSLIKEAAKFQQPQHPLIRICSWKNLTFTCEFYLTYLCTYDYA